MRSILSVGVLALVAFCVASPVTKTEREVDPYRLNHDFEPTKYTVHLNLEADFAITHRFTGIVDVDVVRKTPDSTTLRMHRDIRMTEYNITSGGREVKEQKYDIATEILELDWEDVEEVEEGGVKIGKLHFEYKGVLYEDMSGFYLSTVNAEKKQYIATTQFQPTHARKAFPCFDEPSFKATFVISLSIPNKYKAFSNQPEAGQTRDDTRQTITFKQTPEMPTYLVSFVVSEFNEEKVTEPEPKYSMSIWTSEKSKKTDFAKKVSYKIIKNLGDVLMSQGDAKNLGFENMGIEHLDQVAIPDFAAGAMENWGLVTYRETALLWDETQSTVKDRERVATVIAHEFAHNWFGNWVTLNWWDNTWLNEGFATYFAAHGVNNLEETKDFYLNEQFVLDAVHKALEADGSTGSLPLSSGASTVSDIEAKFDTISYSKGASIIRMMEKMVTKDVFLKNINSYICNNKGKGKTTDPKLLFETFEKFGDEKFEDIMKNWIDEPGYPVITVALKEGKVTATQNEFSYDAIEGDGMKWYVPITKVVKKTRSPTTTDKPPTTTTENPPTTTTEDPPITTITEDPPIATTTVDPPNTTTTEDSPITTTTEDPPIATTTVDPPTTTTTEDPPITTTTENPPITTTTEDPPITTTTENPPITTTTEDLPITTTTDDPSIKTTTEDPTITTTTEDPSIATTTVDLPKTTTTEDPPITTTTEDSPIRTTTEDSPFTTTTEDPNRSESQIIHISRRDTFKKDEILLKPDAKDPLEIHDKLEETELIIVNPENAGYYRVNYDTDLWARIIDELKNNHKNIDAVTRAQLINDAMNLARSGDLKYEVSMELLTYLEHETDYYPWKAAFNTLSFLRKRLVGDDLSKDITETMTKLMKTFYDNNKDFVSKPTDKPLDIYKKLLALEWGCELDGEECVKEAKKLFDEHVNPKQKSTRADLDANLRSIVYCTGLKNSGGDETTNWDTLWENYKKSDVANEKVTILTALGCTKKPDLLKAYLKKSIEDPAIRKQDASMVFKAVLTGTTDGIQVSLDFLNDHFQGIAERYGSMGAIANIVTALADRLTTADQVDKLELFVAGHENELKDAAKAAKNAVAGARANVAWTATFKDDLNKYFHPTSGATSLMGSSFIGLLLIACIHRLM